jgi:hypothetical protein
MRRSQSITLALLGAGMLASCAFCGCPAGSGRRTLYDRNHNVVPRERWYGPDGKPAELYDENGNPVPANEVASAYSSSTSHHSYRRHGGGLWPLLFWGGSGGSTSYGGPRPSTGRPSGSPSTSRPSTGGPVSRGGFGGGGSAVS